jgi:hypothetical protein
VDTSGLVLEREVYETASGESLTSGGGYTEGLRLRGQQAEQAQPVHLAQPVGRPVRQGLTLVHFSPRPEPFLSLKFV